VNILLTGGTGYIASHTAVVLINAGHQVVLYDNLSNSHQAVVKQLETITKQTISFVEGDIRDEKLLQSMLSKYRIDAVIHFAGLKAVGESVQKPIDYYDNNVGGTISLLKVMAVLGIKNLVFSSSATVYGEPQYLPIDEDHPLSATNPYGRTKLHIENMLQDLAASDGTWRIICLRYFNPVGAHESGLIGENPNGIPNNLMPYIARVAAGKLSHLNVFGNDYDTVDGTGVRDYIHVMDLAQGHLAALESVKASKTSYETFNLGTGQGQSVLQMIKAFEHACGHIIPREFSLRRTGDVDACYSTADKALKIMGWRATYSLNEMCKSAWNFQCQATHPENL
jgi:UDP-glucose 4-epimerase